VPIADPGGATGWDRFGALLSAFERGEGLAVATGNWRTTGRSALILQAGALAGGVRMDHPVCWIGLRDNSNDTWTC